MAKTVSFFASNDSQCVERKRTLIVWTLSYYERFLPEELCSPTFEYSSFSWNLTFNNWSSDSKTPCISIVCIAKSAYPFFIPYFKLFILDANKFICFDFTGKNHKFDLDFRTREIVINTMDAHDVSICSPLTVYVDIADFDRSVPLLKKTAELLKEIDVIIGSGSLDGATKGTLDKCGSRGCMSVCSDFEDLFNSRRLSDVTLKLTDGEFQAHKLVLCARSKVFAAMFEHDTKESRTDNVNLVEMEVKTVQDMLRYMYCGKVRDLSSEEALNLYLAADRYDLQELKTFCRELVLNGISTSNVCDIAAVADLHNDEMLIRGLKGFLFKNGKEVIKTEKWKAISTKNTSLGSKMFEWIFSE